MDGILAGMLVAAPFGDAMLTGGDTTRSREGLVIDTMVIGAAPGGSYVTRDGAQDGDVLLVTGSPGDAGAGLHAQEHGHDAPELLRALHRPVPRIKEGAWLAGRAGVHSMIDVSDGLAQDGGHIASASGLGLEFSLNDMPVSEQLQRYCGEHGLDARRMALHSGDAYELALAVDAARANTLVAEFESAFDCTLTAVGTFSKSFDGIRLDGAPLDAGGFDHFRVKHGD